MLQQMRLSTITTLLLLSMAIWLTAGGCAPAIHSRKADSNVTPEERLIKDVEQILGDSLLSQTRVGISIVSLESDEVLFARNSQKLFHPASNMKLLTAAAALTTLGPNFRFKTVLSADSAAVADTTISGSLFIKGFGNPDLVLADLAWMARQLKERGIREINGDLIYDSSYMDDLSWGAGWMWDDVSAWYWAPIGAMTVNDNCVTLLVKPGAEVRDTLIVQMEPPNSTMRIANMGITVDSTDTTRLADFKVQREWRPPKNVVNVRGGMRVGSAPKRYVVDVVDGASFMARLFADILRESSIALEGEIRSGVTPDTTMSLVTHLSEPLSSVVNNTLKSSDNLSAELLLKTVGAELRGPPGTAAKGISVINAFFHTLNIDSTAYGLADGSGVSRYNVVTPDQIVTLLTAMHRDFRVQAEFKAALPIAGVDGLLASRMKETAAEGKLRAKTGTLRGVSALSGYTTTADGELLAFSMIMEHFVVPTSSIRRIQDRISVAISSFSRYQEY